MRTRIAYISLCSALILGLGVRSARAQEPNIVVNGGFETGDLTGWALTGNPAYTQVAGFNWGYDQAHSGSYYAMLGSYGTISTLSQVLNTNIGSDYTLSFYLASDGGQTNEFTVSVAGNMLMDQVDLPASGYVEYNFGFQATSDATTLAFGSRDDPGYLLLDDVSVVDPPPGGIVLSPASVTTPLPSTFAMSLAAMSMMGLAAWRMKRSALPVA